MPSAAGAAKPSAAGVAALPSAGAEPRGTLVLAVAALRAEATLP